MNFHALNLYCRDRNGSIIVHFYIINYTAPIFAGIILDKAKNCKKFLPLIFGKIGSFNYIALTDIQSSEVLGCSGSGYANVSYEISTGIQT